MARKPIFIFAALALISASTVAVVGRTGAAVGSSIGGREGVIIGAAIAASGRY
jgi:hypothetical protein